tara:strand:- start:155 stop:562 length:408 start_codon:yes stop_codon:yes gene_type:complete
MPGVGRNSYKAAMQKAKDRTRRIEVKKGNVPGIDYRENMTTPDRSPTRSVPPDRSPDEVPTKSIFARLTGYFAPTTRMYNSGLTRPLTGDQDTLPGFLQEKILADDEPSKENTKGSPIARHMKFCGGGSKPYKKK